MRPTNFYQDQAPCTPASAPPSVGAQAPPPTPNPARTTVPAALQKSAASTLATTATCGSASQQQTRNGRSLCETHVDAFLPAVRMAMDVLNISKE